MMNFDLVVMTVLYWGRFFPRRAKRYRYTYTIIFGFSRKKSKQGGSGHTFLKNPWNFYVFYLSNGNSTQNKASHLDAPHTKLCVTYVTCLENFQSGLKPRPLEVPHDFFLITPGNFPLLLISPCKIHLLFLQ